MCTLYVRNAWIKGIIEYPELSIFIGKLCTLYMYGISRFAEKLNVQNSVNWTGNCIYNLYGMFGFAEKLNIQNYENSTRNCIHFIHTECMDLQRNGISRMRKLKWKLCTLYARNVWISRKIEYLLLHIFNGKLCTLYMYGMSGFAEKLNIQNCENSSENCVNYICTECLDLQKNWMSRTS